MRCESAPEGLVALDAANFSSLFIGMRCESKGAGYDYRSKSVLSVPSSSGCGVNLGVMVGGRVEGNFQFPLHRDAV